MLSWLCDVVSGLRAPDWIAIVAGTITAAGVVVVFLQLRSLNQQTKLQIRRIYQTLSADRAALPGRHQCAQLLAGEAECGRARPGDAIHASLLRPPFRGVVSASQRSHRRRFLERLARWDQNSRLQAIVSAGVGGDAGRHELRSP